MKIYNKRNIFFLFSALYSSIAVFTPSVAFAQDVEKDSVVINSSDSHTLTGQVTDASTSHRIVGAKLQVVGSKASAISNEEGHFTLRLPAPAVTLVISAPGYATQTIPLHDNQPLSVRLNGAMIAAEADYSEPNVSKADAISEIGFTHESIDKNITSSLLGSLYGTLHSGEDGNGSSLFIRGIHSLNAGTTPLYVVDGVIWSAGIPSGNSIHEGAFDNPLALLNPDDIAKIEVIKNGTAIYGSKGANGVVLIETKRSRNMATQIEAYASLGYTKSYKTLPMMDADDARIYFSDLVKDVYTNSQIENLKFFNDDPTKPYYAANHNNTNWNKLINKGAWKQNYGINVRGGDERALYAFSLGYTRNDGNIKKTDFTRMNIRFNSDIFLSKQLTTRVDIAFSQIDRTLFDDGINALSSPSFLSMIKAPFYSPYLFNSEGKESSQLSDTDDLSIGNPLAIINRADNTLTKYRFNATLAPVYQFNNQWKAGALFSYSWDRVKEASFLPDYGVANMILTNEQGEIYGEGNNRVRSLMSGQKSLTIQAYTTYTPVSNAYAHADITAGYRYLNDSFDTDFGEGYNTGSDNMKGLAQTNANLRTIRGVNEDWSSIAWYAEANLSYLYRYLLRVNATLDTSSRFGDDISSALHMGGVYWGFFPSVEAAWLISSEKWMSGANWLNQLKLKAGFNMAGNDNIISNAYRSYFTSVNYMGKGYGLVLDNIGNPSLKWETTSTFNVGLEWAVFNNRWQFQFDYYTSKTKDLLVQKELKDVAGLPYYWTNDGKLKNHGFELSTNGRIVNTKRFKLDAGVMLGSYRNKVTSMPEDLLVTSSGNGTVLTTNNRPLGVFYGYKYLGVFSDRESAANADLAIITESGKREPFQAGDAHFYDKDGNGIINEDDRVIIGDPNPDFYGNFNLHARFDRFDLNALFTFSHGGNIYNAHRAQLESGSRLHNQSTAIKQRWISEGQQTYVPRATYGDPMGNARFSDRWIEDGSYLRFQSLSLGYTLPVRSNYIEQVQLFGTVNNIFTISDYLGADPAFHHGNDVLSRGIDLGYTPSSCSFQLGVKINL